VSRPSDALLNILIENFPELEPPEAVEIRSTLSAIFARPLEIYR
jgi:hypothetical protein